MKKNLKRIFAAILAAALVLSVTGCGSKDAGLDADGNYEVAWYNSHNPFPDDEMVMEELSKYTKEKIGVTVKYTPFAGAEYAEKMNLLFASGEKIDLCFASTGTKFESNARQFAYMDIGDLLATTGKPIKDLIPNYALEAFKVGGVQYAVPVLKDWAFHPCIQVHQGKLAAAGISVEEYQAPTSLAEFTPIIEKYRKSFPDHYGILMRSNHNLMKFLPQETIQGSVIAGFKFDNYDKVINVFETEEFKELAKVVRQWYQAGYIKNDAATSTSDSDIHKINNYFATHGEWLPYYGCTTADDSPKKTVYALNLCETFLSTTQITPAGHAIGATSINPEKAMEFLNLLYTDEYVRNLTCYGIEGKHWVADGEDHYALPEGYEKKADTGYEGGAWNVGNRFILKVAPKTPADIWEKYQEFNEIAKKSEALGFSFDPQPVSGQIAAINNAYQEYFGSIIVGAVDPEVKIPEFLNKIKTIGADQVIAEAQRQYDEWRKNK